MIFIAVYCLFYAAGAEPCSNRKRFYAAGAGPMLKS